VSSYLWVPMATEQAMPNQRLSVAGSWIMGYNVQRTFIVRGSEDESLRFQVYQRQNLHDKSDFSCGISYHPQGTPPLTLARYNRPCHRHREIAYRPHVHRTTERAIAEGKKPESEAEETAGFEDLDGALVRLIEDFNLSGVEVSRNPQQEMFT